MKLLLATGFILGLAVTAGLPPLPLSHMIGYAAVGCFCGGSACALRKQRKWQGWYPLFQVAAWTSIFGVGACLATARWHQGEPAAAWSVLGTVLLSSLWGYSALDTFWERFDVGGKGKTNK